MRMKRKAASGAEPGRMACGGKGEELEQQPNTTHSGWCVDPSDIPDGS